MEFVDGGDLLELVLKSDGGLGAYIHSLVFSYFFFVFVYVTLALARRAVLVFSRTFRSCPVPTSIAFSRPVSSPSGVYATNVILPLAIIFRRSLAACLTHSGSLPVALVYPLRPRPSFRSSQVSFFYAFVMSSASAPPCTVGVCGVFVRILLQAFCPSSLHHSSTVSYSYFSSLASYGLSSQRYYASAQVRTYAAPIWRCTACRNASRSPSHCAVPDKRQSSTSVSFSLSHLTSLRLTLSSAR